DVVLFLRVFGVGVAAGEGLDDVFGLLGPLVLAAGLAPEFSFVGRLEDVVGVGVDGVGVGAPDDEVVPEDGVVGADGDAGHLPAVPELLAGGGVEEAG